MRSIAELEEWRVSGGEPDWDDVLRRSRAAGASRRRVALVVGLAAASASAPALALAPMLRDLIGGGSNRTVVSLRATLRTQAGAPAGRVVIQTSNVILVRGAGGKVIPRVVGRPGRGTVTRPLLLWRLTLRAGRGAISAAEIRTEPSARGGRTLLQLCAPCRHGVARTVRPSAAALRVVFGGPVYAVVRTERGVVAGRLALGRLRHIEIRRP
jgi:hypothetical protein